MTQPHPTDRSLAALLDGRIDLARATDMHSHINTCARCQLRLGQAAESTVGAYQPTPSLEQLPITPTTEARDVNPARGDIWRLGWDHIAQLAVVWRSGTSNVEVMPLIPTTAADEWTHRTSTPALGDIAISVALSTVVPNATLDARLDHTETAAVADLRQRYRQGAEPPNVGPARDRTELATLDQIGQDLADLSNAHWAPVATPIDPPTYEQLRNIVGLETHRALDIAGSAAPTPTEAAQIEAALGVTFPTVHPIAIEVSNVIDLPRHKQRIQRAARKRRQRESEFRLSIAQQLDPPLLAARGSKGKSPLDAQLTRLLDQILDE